MGDVVVVARTAGALKILDHLARVVVGAGEVERLAVPAEADDGPAAGRGTKMRCGVGEADRRLEAETAGVCDRVWGICAPPTTTTSNGS